MEGALVRVKAVPAWAACGRLAPLSLFPPPVSEANGGERERTRRRVGGIFRQRDSRWHPPPRPAPLRGLADPPHRSLRSREEGWAPPMLDDWCALKATKPRLRRHQFDAAVERAAGIGGVAADGGEKADAGGAQPRLRDAIAPHELGRDGLGAASRQV